MRPSPVVITAFAMLFLAGCSGGEGRSGQEGAAESSPEWPVSTASADARERLAEAEAAVDAGLTHDGYNHFKRAVAADSAFAFGYLRLAQNAYSLDEYRANLERANAFAATASPAERLMINAENVAFAGDVQGAIDSLRKAAALMPDNPRPLLLIMLQQGDQIDSLRATAARLIEIAPQWGRSHLENSNVYGTLAPRDFAKAQQHIEMAQKLWPDKPYTYDILGDVRRAEGRLDEAAAAYSRQIELAPTDGEGYNQRGHAYTFLGRFDDGRADYDQSIRLGKGNRPAIEAYYRALVDAYAGHPDRAVRNLEELVEAIDGMGVPDPDGMKTGALKDIITLALTIDRPDIAERALARIIPLNNSALARVNTPEFRRAVEADNALWTGAVALAKGDYAAATARAEEYRMLREPDRNPGKLQPYYNLLGHVALGQKNYDDAEKKLAQSNPENMEVQFARAQALEALGRVDEAQALYKLIVGYNFNNGEYAAVRSKAVAKAR